MSRRFKLTPFPIEASEESAGIRMRLMGCENTEQDETCTARIPLKDRIVHTRRRCISVFSPRDEMGRSVQMALNLRVGPAEPRSPRLKGGLPAVLHKTGSRWPGKRAAPVRDRDRFGGNAQLRARAGGGGEMYIVRRGIEIEIAQGRADACARAGEAGSGVRHRASAASGIIWAGEEEEHGIKETRRQPMRGRSGSIQNKRRRAKNRRWWGFQVSARLREEN
ncbi:hypothetical protein B0H13DRAFT_1889503 [Mycena leptocephala]|nr:hypothetical protein B0H13DRAFT_1889503 [Mycena leptocephala]